MQEQNYSIEGFEEGKLEKHKMPLFEYMLNYEDDNRIIEISSLVFFQSNLKEITLEKSESSLQCNDIGVLLKTLC